MSDFIDWAFKLLISPPMVLALLTYGFWWIFLMHVLGADLW